MHRSKTSILREIELEREMLASDLSRLPKARDPETVMRLEYSAHKRVERISMKCAEIRAKDLMKGFDYGV